MPPGKSAEFSLEILANALRQVQVVNGPQIRTVAGDVLSANGVRRAWAVQNLGTNTLYVRLGAGASATLFHIALQPGSANDDGKGGYFSDEAWQGVVSIAGTSPRYCVTEIS